MPLMPVSKQARIFFALSILTILWSVPVLFFSSFDMYTVSRSRSDGSILYTINQRNNFTNFIFRPRFGLIADIHPQIDEEQPIYTKMVWTSLDRDLAQNLFLNMSDGDIVAVQLYHTICFFIGHILPSIQTYFSLVIISSNDWYTPIDYLRLKCRPFAQLIRNKYLLYIFTVNHDGSLPHIVKEIPLGLCLRVGWKAKRSFPGFNDSVAMQERRISDIVNEMMYTDKYNHREFKIYTDHGMNYSAYHRHLNKWNEIMGTDYVHHYYQTKLSNRTDSIFKMRHKRHEYRAYAIQSIQNISNQTLIYYQKGRIAQYEQYEMRKKYVFSFALFGRGLDTFRVWESLLFGNIVITQSSPLDKLYKEHNFPVVTVEDFREINFKMLQFWYDKYKGLVAVNNVETFKKLQMNYWAKHIKQETMSKLMRIYNQNGRTNKSFL